MTRKTASSQFPSTAAVASTQARWKSHKTLRKPPKPAMTLNAKSLVDLATSANQVSSFCQAVLSKLVPNEFWGASDCQDHNKAVVMKKVDHFVKLRRFESMSLHEVLQDLKVTVTPFPSLVNAHENS